jgi:DNA polymerase III delta subunit
MLSIFLGPDDFSKKEQIKSLAGQTQAELEFFYEDDDLPQVTHLTAQNLFSQPKVVVLENLVNKLNLSQSKEQLIQTSNYVILTEEKLDKRTSLYKILSSDKKIKIQEFFLPHGGQLNRWIEARVKSLGGAINKDAIELLAIKLGRDEAKQTKLGGKIVEVMEEYNLWQAENEIKKLLALACGRTINKDDVQNLVHYNIEIDALQIANAIAENNKQKTLNLINSFLVNQSAVDQKSAVLQLAALLSEQFRNVALTQDFLAERIPDAEILKKTSWKNGRLFIMRKISQRFTLQKVLDFLKKLENLDQELKTSSTPPRVILDLIVSQAFV